MQRLIDLYKDNPELVKDLLTSEVEVSLKIEGLSLQILYNDETGKYEYRKRSKDIAIGPIITKLEKYFCKQLLDSISLLKTKFDIIEQYRFLNFKIYNNELILLSAMLKNDTVIIDDSESIQNISEQLGVNGITCLWKGKLSDDQQTNIINMLNFNTIMSSEEFKDYIKTLFTSPSCIGKFSRSEIMFPIDLFDSLKEIPGVIFNFKLGDKISQYQIEDLMHEQNQANIKSQRNMKININKAFVEDIVKEIADYLENHLERLSDIHMENLEKKFVKMMQNKRMYNKLMNLSSNLPIYNDSIYKLQLNLLTPELQVLINKKGSLMKSLYENYLIMFYHTKENSIVIDKDFTKRLNKIIEKL